MNKLVTLAFLSLSLAAPTLVLADKAPSPRKEAPKKDAPKKDVPKKDDKKDAPPPAATGW